VPRLGRSASIDVDALKALVEKDPRFSSRCLAERLQCDHAAVLKHLHNLGKTWKYGAWIPHHFALHQLQLRVDLCMFHLGSHANEDWLEHLVTGDEKWILYVNHTRKRQ
jgi:histone-lysine N-methyltransferase SETMAR